jgi:hypothetical protein
MVELDSVSYDEKNHEAPDGVGRASASVVRVVREVSSAGVAFGTFALDTGGRSVTIAGIENTDSWYLPVNCKPLEYSFSQSIVTRACS